MDALVYHLRIPHEYLRAGRMAAITDDVRAFQPFNVEMLFAFGMGLRDDVVAALLHWLLGIGAALTAGAWARRLGAKSALVAIAVFAVSPLYVWESTSSFIDLGLTLFSSLALLWATRSDLGRSGVALAGVFAGLAAGSKFTGCTVAALVGGVAFLQALPDRRRASARLLAVGALAVAIASPWYLRNALWTGNPFLSAGEPPLWKAAARPAPVELCLRVRPRPPAFLYFPFRSALARRSFRSRLEHRAELSGVGPDRPRPPPA